MDLIRRRSVSLFAAVVVLSLGWAVTVSPPDVDPLSLVPLAHGKPAGGLEVSIEPGAGSTARARVLPERSFGSVRVELSSSGGVRLTGSTVVVVPAPVAGREISLDVPYAYTGDDPGRIGLSATAVGEDGRAAVDRGDELFVQRFGDGELRSTSGPLDLQVQAVRRSGGSPADLDLTLGAGAKEETTTAARGSEDPDLQSPVPALAGGTVNVSGRIQYDDSAGNPHPVRSAPVEIRDSTGPGASVLVATVNTDGNGNYGATVDNAHPGGGNRNIFVRVLARSAGFRILVPGGGGDIHRIDSSVSNNVADGTNLTLNLRANNTADNNTAFSVHDALVTQVAYTTGLLGAALPDVDVDFPTAANTSNFSGGVLHILRLDRFDWDVNNHEYGHYFMSTQGISASPGGRHSSADNLSETEGRNKDQGIRLAWGEGFPTYFGTSMQLAMGTAAFGIPNVGDTFYSDTEDLSVRYDVETSTGGTSIGEDNELAISRILWDLWDAAGDTGDDRGVALGEPTLFNILDAGATTTLSAATTAVVAGRTPRQIVDIGCVLTEHRVAPRITAPGDHSLARSATPPAITWSAQGGGPAHRNNRFVVQFYDANFAPLFSSPEQTGTSYTPPQANWTTVIGTGASRRASVNIAVRARQTDAPETGPFTGCNITLDSDLVPPSTTAGTSPAPNAAGWHRTNVTVNLSATDNPGGVGVRDVTYSASGGQTIGSTVVGGSSASFQITSEGLTTVSYFATDQEGNAEQSRTLVIKLDKTPPANVAVTTDRPPDHNGWYNNPFTATWTGTDALSGIAGCTQVTWSGPDTANGSIPGGCTDVAGNTTTVPLAFRYDATAPVNVRGVPDRPPDSNGWYNRPVTITFTGEDATSGIDSCTAVTYSGPDTAGAVLPGGCTDRAGNTANASFELRYDHTPPTTAINRGENVQILVLVAGAPVTGTAADNLSGVASTTVTFRTPFGVLGTVTRTATCTSGCGTTAARWSVSTKGLLGLYTVTARSTDVAGNLGPPSRSLVISVSAGV